MRMMIIMETTKICNFRERKEMEENTTPHRGQEHEEQHPLHTMHIVMTLTFTISVLILHRFDYLVDVNSMWFPSLAIDIESWH